MTPTGNTPPVVDRAGRIHDPATRTPFALDRQRRPTPTATRSPTCGSRTTPAARHGTALTRNTKTDGPLFRAVRHRRRRSAPTTPPPTTRPARTPPAPTRRGCSPTCADRSPATRTRRPAPVPRPVTRDRREDRLLLGVPADHHLPGRRCTSASPRATGAPAAVASTRRHDVTLAPVAGPFRVTAPNTAVTLGRRARPRP